MSILHRTSNTRAGHALLVPSLLAVALVGGASPGIAQERMVAASASTKAGLDKDSRLVGTWGIDRASTDKEAPGTETTVIQFNQDGSYTTSVRHSLFPEQAKQALASGRYALADADKAGFTLQLERAGGDPDADKSTTREKLRVVVLDDGGLRAEDGSVIRRIK